MKHNAPFEKPRKRIATFGAAELVINRDGKLELRGGSKPDQLAAREWISLFMHEAAPRILPG